MYKFLAFAGERNSDRRTYNGEVEVEFTVGTVAELAGLSPEVIRAWERRYGTASPKRTATNRRVYDAEDVRRFTLLKQLVDSGHTIGRIATLPTESLAALLGSRTLTPQDKPVDEGLLGEARHAVERLDASALNDLLVSATARLGVLKMIETAVMPLVREVGHGWHTGTTSIHQEHFLTAVLRTHLDRMRQDLNPRRQARTVVVTTPARQFHELGALFVSIVATLQDWTVVYLGPNLPAPEIAGAVSRVRADAIALSVIFPVDDDGMRQELVQLRQLVGAKMPIYLGGSGASAYRGAIDEINATLFESFEEFQSALDRVAHSIGPITMDSVRKTAGGTLRSVSRPEP